MITSEYLNARIVSDLTYFYDELHEKKLTIIMAKSFKGKFALQNCSIGF